MPNKLVSPDMIAEEALRTLWAFDLDRWGVRDLPEDEQEQLAEIIKAKLTGINLNAALTAFKSEVSRGSQD